MVTTTNAQTRLETVDLSQEESKVASLQIPFSTQQSGDIALLAMHKGSLYISSADGTVQCIKGTHQEWIRDESLSRIISSAFVRKKKVEKRQKTNFMQLNLTSLFDNNYIAEPTTSLFHQHWIVATAFDTILAIDTADGSTLWRHYIPGAKFTRVSVIRDSDVDLDSPLLVSFGSTSIQIDGLSGEYSIISKVPSKFAAVLSMRDASSQALLSVFVDSEDKVTLYPGTLEARKLFESKPFYFSTGLEEGSNVIVGYQTNMTLGADLVFFWFS
jgi:hypothetical protein